MPDNLKKVGRFLFGSQGSDTQAPSLGALQLLGRTAENMGRVGRGAQPLDGPIELQRNAMANFLKQREMQQQQLSQDLLTRAIMGVSGQIAEKSGVQGQKTVNSPEVTQSMNQKASMQPIPNGYGAEISPIPNGVKAPPMSLMGSGMGNVDKISGNGITVENADKDIQKDFVKKLNDTSIKIANIGTEKQTESQAVLESDVMKSSFVNENNINLVAGNLHDLSNILAQSYEQGVAGDALKKGLNYLADNGYMPASMADKYETSSQVSGKLFEIQAKMFPVLTQQIGKEGSVRLIESIFKKLGTTLPDTGKSPKISRQQMRSTIETMIRVNKSIKDINLDEFDLNNPNAQNTFSDSISRTAKSINLSEEEKELSNRVIRETVRPIDEYIVNKEYPKELHSAVNEALDNGYTYAQIDQFIKKGKN